MKFSTTFFKYFSEQSSFLFIFFIVDFSHFWLICVDPKNSKKREFISSIYATSSKDFVNSLQTGSMPLANALQSLITFRESFLSNSVGFISWPGLSPRTHPKTYGKSSAWSPSDHLGLIWQFPLCSSFSDL